MDPSVVRPLCARSYPAWPVSYHSVLPLWSYTVPFKILLRYRVGLDVGVLRMVLSADTKSTGVFLIFARAESRYIYEKQVYIKKMQTVFLVTNLKSRVFDYYDKIQKQAGMVFTPPPPSQNYQEVE